MEVDTTFGFPLRMDMMEEEERETGSDILGGTDDQNCILCGFSFARPHNQNRDLSIQKLQNFWDYIYQMNGDVKTSETKLRKPHSVCPDCLHLTSSAMDKKLEVDEIEKDVRKLQRLVLQEMRKLQRRITEHHLEMHKICDVVRNSDVGCLVESAGNADTTPILKLRKAIISVSRKMGKFKEVMKSKFCSSEDPQADDQMPEPEEENLDTMEDENRDDDSTPYSGTPYHSNSGDARKSKNFKKQIIKMAESESKKWQIIKVDDDDQKYYFNYEPVRDKFAVGEVEVEVDNDSKCLECSECLFRVNCVTIESGKRNLAEEMQHHIRREHLLEFQCSLCPALLGSYEGYWKHFPREHPSLNLFEVPTTFETERLPTKSTSKLQQKRPKNNSSLSDDKDKPFQCDKCDKRFKNKKNLSSHLSTHLEERPYVCEKGCGYAFKSSKHIARHEKTCKGEMNKIVLAKWKRESQK